MTRRGAGALIALSLILVTTAAWWALALVPLAPSAPEWLTRTRAICFGAGPDSLPHSGGWLLLIGEPIGMLAALLTGWRDAVREGCAALARGWSGRLAMVLAGLLMLTGSTLAAERILSVRDGQFDPEGGPDPRGVVVAGRMDRAAPALDLVDQHGRGVRTSEFRGRFWMVTFAYAHCTTVCPVIVRDLLAVRRYLGNDAPPLVIVTLDPWRDTPTRLPALAAAWHLDAGSRVLSGEVEQVELVLSRWQVPRSRNVRTGELIHPSIVYLVNSAGRITHLVDGSVDATLLALAEAGIRADGP
jgi:cytochrome oxidase Cu insertion factor (SCO1/SenC/PrrC family)